MAAILGRVAFDGRPVNERLFRRAFDALRPARCTRSDMVVAGATGFGHHDSGLNGAAPQPLQDGSLTLVADARLYNREDVARALDVRAQEHSDASLILRAYGRWGAGCLAYLNGDFGFAIHDRSTGEVFLARDHIGARPLFWTRRGGEVLFATLLHGMTGFDDLDWPLSEARIARYLCNPNDFRLESFLDGVEAVGPGHWVQIRAGLVTRERWWNPAALQERAGITPEAALEELRARTETAVRVRLPADAPVGAHFSGGIDSTLVTLLASQSLKDSGRNLAGAYAWCPPVSDRAPDMGRRDERRMITAQCAAIDVPARFGAATGATFDTLAALPMELQGTADLMDELPIIEQAQSDGLGVMLSGWGGDEVFSTHGIGHLAWLLRNRRPGPVLQVARRFGGGLRRPHRMAALLWRASIVPMLPDALYKHFSPFSDIYSDGAFPSAACRRIYETLDQSPSVRLLPDADAYMQSLLLKGHIAERMATWTAWSAPAGFEYRYPLTDRSLLEFMLTLPRDIRFGDGTGRYLARRAFAQLLPEGVNKTDIANEKLRGDNRLEWSRILAEDLRKGRFARACPWLDMTAMTDMILQEPSRDKGAQVKAFARLFVAIRVYEIYRRTHSPARSRPALSETA